MSASLEPEERSIQDIIRDIGGNIQGIIRSEIRLAKIELGETVKSAKSSLVAFSTGGVLALYAIGFIALAAMFALELFLPAWLAALIIGVLLFIGAAIGIGKGRQQLKNVRPPEKTIQTVKEDFQWMKEQAKS
jgi:uncharacterized membrane protein YqjE